MLGGIAIRIAVFEMLDLSFLYMHWRMNFKQKSDGWLQRFLVRSLEAETWFLFILDIPMYVVAKFSENLWVYDSEKKFLPSFLFCCCRGCCGHPTCIFTEKWSSPGSSSSRPYAQSSLRLAGTSIHAFTFCVRQFCQIYRHASVHLSVLFIENDMTNVITFGDETISWVRLFCWDQKNLFYKSYVASV